MLSVRFGNVLGTRGSGLAAFQHQIQAGGPVTVTDPAVTRYFMTVEEAVQLIVQAGAIGDDGAALVLDMGEPVRIAELAELLIARSGEPVGITYTGLRSGEKLHEVLVSEGEDLQPTSHPLISRVAVPIVEPAELDSLADHMGDPLALVGELRRLTGASSSEAPRPESSAADASSPMRAT